MSNSLTHKDLVEIGYRWCLSRCGFAFKELVTLNPWGEVPDVIGFNTMGSFLLEAKTSRNDFLADRAKPFRRMPEHGVGDWRFMICPKGLISVEELSVGWGLIEVESLHKRPVVTHNPFGKGNIYCNWHRNIKSNKAEIALMYSALRRLHELKLIDNIYVKNCNRL